jgi:hypothetical protein
MLDDKINLIREACTPLIGRTIERLETAEIRHDDGTWSDWPDLPIRVYCSNQQMLSIAWSRFDDLWLSNDTSLPFVAEDATTRWKSNGIAQIKGAVGRKIQNVLLGRGQMTIAISEHEHTAPTCPSRGRQVLGQHQNADTLRTQPRLTSAPALLTQKLNAYGSIATGDRGYLTINARTCSAW